MKPRFLLLICTLRLSALFAAAEETVTIRGGAANGLALALQSFKNNRNSKFEGHPVYGDLKHYRIEVTRREKYFEITFIPDQSPLKKGEAGTGGGTDYGWDVTYLVSLDGNKILREHFWK